MVIKPVRVCIIGAGISGITAAAELLKKSQDGQAPPIDLEILEARDRIGGRIHSHRTHRPDNDPPRSRADNGWGVPPFECGPFIIHGIDGNPIYKFALKAQTRLYNIESERSFYKRGHPPLPDAKSALFHITAERFAQEAVEYSKRHRDAVRPETSLKDFIIDRIENDQDCQNKMDANDRRMLLQMCDFYSSFSAAPFELQSLKYYFLEANMPGEQPMVIGGYDTILRCVAGDYPTRTSINVLDYVKLNSVVKNIDYSDKVVKVTLTNGTIHTADHVIITVPLGVLKASISKSRDTTGTISFTPSLPKYTHIGPITRLGFGTLDKIFLTYNKPLFQDESDVDFMIPFNLGSKEPNGPPTLNDLASRFIGYFVLPPPELGPKPSTRTYMGLFSKPLSEMMDKCDTEKQMAYLADTHLRSYAAYNGSTDARLLSYKVTKWAHDPFSRGSYTHIPIASDDGSFATDKDLRFLQTPLGDGRLLFSGEHTEPRNYATVLGGYLSGQRVAQQLVDIL